MIDSKLILMYFAIIFGAGDKSIAESKGKKVKFRTGHESPEGEKYRYTVSWTLALDGLGGQRHTPATLPPR